MVSDKPAGDKPAGVRRRGVLTGIAGAASVAGAGLLAHRGGLLGGSDAGRALPSARPLRYAVIGASDAVGLGVRSPRRDGWVPRFASTLPQPVEVLNLGVPGSTLRQAIQQQLPRAVEAQPHLITVWLVVNDVLAGVTPWDYAQDIDQLLKTLRRETDSVVAIANAPFPPAGLDPWGLPEAARRAVAMLWNAPIAAAARSHGAVLVDLYRRWVVAENPAFIGPDRLHPTAEGYRALADVFAETLRDAGVVNGPRVAV